MTIYEFFVGVTGDPRLYGSIGVIFLLLIIWIPYFSHKEAYKRFWKGCKKIGHRTHRLITTMILFTAVVAFIGVYFAVSVETVRNIAPTLYDWTAPYERVFFLIFWGMVIASQGFKLMVMGDRQDDGVINDIDQKRWDDQKELKDAYRDQRIEEVEHNRQKDAEFYKQALAQRDKEHKELVQLVVKLSNGLYRLGERGEGEPQLPPGKVNQRIIERDASIPVTEETVNTEFLPELVPVDEVKTEDHLPSENASAQEGETETEKKHNPYDYSSSIDQKLWGKKPQ